VLRKLNKRNSLDILEIGTGKLTGSSSKTTCSFLSSFLMTSSEKRMVLFFFVPVGVELNTVVVGAAGVVLAAVEGVLDVAGGGRGEIGFVGINLSIAGVNPFLAAISANK
jgi:hypothetical protein